MGPGTHCCPRKDVHGEHSLCTALLWAHCSACPDRQGETRGGEQRPREDRRRLAGHSWGQRFTQALVVFPLVSPETFFFLSGRETHPPWQFADSLKHARTDGLRGARRREERERKQKSHRVQALTPEPPAAGPWAWGGAPQPRSVLLAQPMGPVVGRGALGPEDAEPCPPWAG